MTMKYMMEWKIPPANYDAAVKRFVKTGGPAPAGLKQLGRWHAPGSSHGYLLVEGDEAALGEQAAEWADVVEWKVHPVVEDDVAGPVAAKIAGR
jgi:hypothetical protein